MNHHRCTRTGLRRKGEMAVSLQDTQGYAGIDSGCPTATEYLGEQSSCLNCPFEDKGCVLDHITIGGRPKNIARDERIRRLYKGGQSIDDIAESLDVKRRTIRRVLGFAKS